MSYPSLGGVRPSRSAVSLHTRQCDVPARYHPCRPARARREPGDARGRAVRATHHRDRAPPADVGQKLSQQQWNLRELRGSRNDRQRRLPAGLEAPRSSVDVHARSVDNLREPSLLASTLTPPWHPNHRADQGFFIYRTHLPQVGATDSRHTSRRSARVEVTQAIVTAIIQLHVTLRGAPQATGAGQS